MKRIWIKSICVISIENDEITKLKVALEESITRERIAIKELQKMRQRAEKAEKTIINKAHEWLKSHVNDDVLVKCGSVVKCMNSDEFIEYFCKAMEE